LRRKGKEGEQQCRCSGSREEKHASPGVTGPLPAGRRWHLDTNGCTGVADFFRLIDDNLSGLPAVAAALEVTRALPVGLRGSAYFLNGLELVREECAIVFLDSDGRTHAQACCYLAVARASARGATAVKALGGLLETDSNARSARLGAVRAALTPFEAPLKKLLVPTANIAARERGCYVDFQMSIPAEEEVHLSYALQVGTLKVVSDAGPLEW
jgi:hypothetical protein